MILHPAVTIHGLADARMAVASGLPVTLLSAPGAGVFAGCLWWRAIMDRVRDNGPVFGILDCAGASGQALAALRIGVRHLVLWPDAPGWASVAAIAAEAGGFVLPEAPPSLDLARERAGLQLIDWLTPSQPESQDTP